MSQRTTEQQRIYNTTPAAIARRSEYAKRPERQEIRKVHALRAGLKRIGWTPELRELYLASQAHSCMICKRRAERLVCDHEHTKPPRPRALLCDPCNLSLGYYEKWQRPAGLVIEPYEVYLKTW